MTWKSIGKISLSFIFIRKLKIIQDENKKNLRDFDAKSSSSKVEKEMPKIENKDKFLKISTPKRKGFQENSLSISNRKKDLPFKFTQEKINKKEDENKENEGLNAKIKPQQVFKRAPLQNILSFNDKEKNVSSQEETKKRKYESLETNKMPFFSDINELKKVKLNNQQTQFYQTKQLSRNQNKNTPKKPSQTKIIQENDIESEQMMRAIEIYLFNNGSNETKKNVTKNSNVLNYL